MKISDRYDKFLLNYSNLLKVHVFRTHQCSVEPELLPMEF